VARRGERRDDTPSRLSVVPAVDFAGWTEVSSSPYLLNTSVLPVLSSPSVGCPDPNLWFRNLSRTHVLLTSMVFFVSVHI
jgi:hypothetical protein